MPGILEQRLSDQPEEKKKRKSGADEFEGSKRGRRQKPEPDPYAETYEDEFQDDSPAGKKKRRKDERKTDDDASLKASERYMKGRPVQEEDLGPYDDTPLTEEDVRELDMLEAVASQEEYLNSERKRRTARRISTAVLTVVCVYLTILIYGTIVTEFRYDEKGRITPVELTVQDIANRNEYSSVIGAYLQCRSIYEEILVLDYRMAAGVDDMMAIAPEYEEVVEQLDGLAVQIEAMTVGPKYTQILSMLLTWVNMHAFNYCRYMSIAVTQNDAQAADEAVAARQYVLDTFRLITQNVITLGSEIRGYDLTDLKEWSPDGYVQSSVVGVPPSEQ